MKRFLWLLIATLLFSACSTAVIPEPKKNFIPSGMSQSEVKQTILKAIARLAPTTTSQIVLHDILSVHGASSHWYVEKVEPQVIRAATRPRGQHYVAVNVQYTETQWWVTIVDGENIKFDGKHIHENALPWVQKLERTLHQAFLSYQIGVDETPKPDGNSSGDGG